MYTFTRKAATRSGLHLRGLHPVFVGPPPDDLALSAKHLVHHHHCRLLRGSHSRFPLRPPSLDSGHVGVGRYTHLGKGEEHHKYREHLTRVYKLYNT